jgi:hypothetical protein
MEQRWNDIDREKSKNSEKNLTQSNLAQHRSDWIVLTANPGHRGENPVTNRCADVCGVVAH